MHRIINCVSAICIVALAPAIAAAQEVEVTQIKLPGENSGTRSNFIAECDDGSYLVHAFGERQWFFKLNHDLSIDTTFGEAGFKPLSERAVFGQQAGNAVFLSTDAPYEDFVIHKYTMEGALDTGFGQGGTLAVRDLNGAGIDTTYTDTYAADGRDGSIFLAGLSSDMTKFNLVKLDPTGHVDRAFGAQGVATAWDLTEIDGYVPKKGQTSGISAPILLGDGRLIVSATACAPNEEASPCDGFPNVLIVSRDGRTVERFAKDVFDARRPESFNIYYDGVGKVYAGARDGGSVLKIDLNTQTLDPTFGNHGDMQSEDDFLVVTSDSLYSSFVGVWLTRYSFDGVVDNRFGDYGTFQHSRDLVVDFATWEMRAASDGSILQTWGEGRSSHPQPANLGTVLVTRLRH